MADHSAPASMPIAVHHGRLEPHATTCGRHRVPRTTLWPDVNCCACLDKAPPYPGLEAQRERCRGQFRETDDQGR